MENMRVAEFKKVSLEQFKKDMVDTFGHKYFDEEIEEFYNHIKLPVMISLHHLISQLNQVKL